MKLIIRDSYATLNNSTETHELRSGGLQILDDASGTLWAIRLQSDGAIEVSASSTCLLGGVVLDDAILVKPISGNRVIITRPPYDQA